MNKVILTKCRLTRDPDLRFAAGTGTAVCKFTVAVNREFKKDESDFINCIAFGKTAETIGQYFTKGSEINIVGSIQTGSYDKQDGTRVYTTDVKVDSFEFGAKKNDSNSNVGNQRDSFSGQAGFEYDITPVEDGDMPF